MVTWLYVLWLNYLIVVYFLHLKTSLINTDHY